MTCESAPAPVERAAPEGPDLKALAEAARDAHEADNLAASEHGGDRPKAIATYEAWLRATVALHTACTPERILAKGELRGIDAALARAEGERDTLAKLGAEYLRCDDVGGNRPSDANAMNTQRARHAFRTALAALPTDDRREG